MNGHAATSGRIRLVQPPGRGADARVNALDDAIHHLAQPITALMFVIEMGRLQPNADLWKASLDSASDECRRAVSILDEVRSAAAAMAANCKEDA